MTKKKLERTREKFGTIKTVKLDLTGQKDTSYLTNMYSNSAFAFGLCSDIENDKTLYGKVKLLEPFTTCRENLADKVIRRTCRGANDHGLPNRTCVVVSITSGKLGPKSPVPMGQFLDPKHVKNGKSIYSYKEHMLRSCEGSLNLLNHFEKRNKWLRTKLYKVEYNLETDRYIMYYFAGSKWWIQAPQTFSLFNLLIRLGRYDVIQKLHKNASYKSIIAALEEYANNDNFSDVYAVRNYKGWIKLLDNYKVVYKDRTEPFANWKGRISRFDGIQNLLNNNCNDNAMQKRFNSL